MLPYYVDRLQLIRLEQFYFSLYRKAISGHVFFVIKVATLITLMVPFRGPIRHVQCQNYNLGIQFEFLR